MRLVGQGHPRIGGLPNRIGNLADSPTLEEPYVRIRSVHRNNNIEPLRPVPPLALALFQKYWKPVVVSRIPASILTGGVGIISISNLLNDRTPMDITWPGPDLE